MRLASSGRVDLPCMRITAISVSKALLWYCVEVDRATVSTRLSFHRAKGLEADYTILLDVSEGDYGVPSQIEDDELPNLVMPRPRPSNMPRSGGCSTSP